MSCEEKGLVDDLKQLLQDELVASEFEVPEAVREIQVSVRTSKRKCGFVLLHLCAL